MGGGAYLKRRTETSEKGGTEGEPVGGGGCRDRGWAGSGGLRTDRTALNWTNWPEMVMSNSAPKKEIFAIWRWGGGGHRRIREVVVWKLCSEA